MLTKNGIKRFIGCSGGESSTTKQIYIDINNNTYVGTAYNNDYQGYWRYSYSLSTTSVINGTMVLALGKGNKAVSVDDIDLADRLSDELFETVTGNSDVYTDGKINLLKTYKYIGSEEITISEIGMFFNHRNDKFFLEAREVLEAPITVSNGDIFTVNMIIGV